MQQSNQGAKRPSVYVVIDHDQKENLFAKKTATALSIIQMALGVTSILSQIIIIILLSTYRSSYREHMAGIGEGIYCGVFFIIAGSLGLLASRKPTTCNISAFMTLSILAAIFSAVQIIIASINLTSAIHGYYIEAQETKIAMFGVMTLSALAEGVIAIVCSAICCRACCCTGAVASGQVVYLSQGGIGAGGAPMQMVEGAPVQISGGFPVQMSYLPEPIPAIGASDQKPSELPSYGDVVQEELKVKETEKTGSGGYMRF